jgi:RecA/RadA recombinase
LSKNKWMKKMANLPGAVTDTRNPHEDVIRVTRSPSVNFTFANGHGLPRGYTMMIYGPGKGGKSLACYDTIGALHEDSETAVAALWSTEMRSRLQLTPDRYKVHGIDADRFMRFETNLPEEIFDTFEKDIAAMCEEGMDLRLAIIDSTSGIQGRREATTESVSKFTVGDHAQTMQIGLKRILPVIRKYNIALILVTHLRAEMDQTLAMRNGGVKPQASWAVRHFAEYFCYVERNDTLAGQKDAQGKSLRNEQLRDIRDDSQYGELEASKMRFIMKDNSCGPRGRMGEYTFNLKKGIMNVNQEVFLLCKARGIITLKGSSYSFGDRKWAGKDAVMEDLAKDTDLQKAMLMELRKRDMEGAWGGLETDEGHGEGVVNLEDAEIKVGE